jgi:hypothetical protein
VDEAAARVIAKAAVQETFTALGVDVTTPAGIIETQQDFAWTRGMRLTARKLRMHMVTVVLTVMASGVCYAVWQAIVAKAESEPPAPIHSPEKGKN